MTADPELRELAARFGVDLDPPVDYRLADDGRRVLTNGHVAGCPLECEGRHGEQGCSCPYRVVSLAEALPDPYLRRLKITGAL